MATVGLPGIQIPGIPVPRLPSLSSGRIVAPVAGWQRVPYIDLFTGAPVVYARPPVLLVVAEARAGWFTLREFRAPAIQIQLPIIELPPAMQISVPTVQVPAVPEVPPFSLPSASVSAISIPTVTLPSVSISLPTVSIPRTTVTASEFDGWMQVNLWPLRLSDDWGPLNWIKDGIRVALSKLMERLWSAFVQKQIDQVAGGVQTAINRALANTQAQINNGLKTTRDNVQAAINAMINDANLRIAGLKDSVNVAFKTITDGANKNLANFRVNVNNTIQQIPSSVQGALNTFRTNIESGVNTAFKSNRDKLQAALDSYRIGIQDQVNSGLKQVTGYTTTTLNEIIPTLWRTLGLPERQLFVPILYRANTDHFEFFAPAAGVVVHYAAWGA